jgi:hypothetical protein
VKLKTLAASLLIVLGILAFVYQGVLYRMEGRGVNYDSTRATDPIRRVPLPPIVGSIALITGIAMLLVDKNDFNQNARLR